MSQRWVDYSGSEGEGMSSDEDKNNQNLPRSHKKKQRKQEIQHNNDPVEKQMKEPELQIKKSSKNYTEIPIQKIHTLQRDYVWLLVRLYPQNRQKQSFFELKEKVDKLSEQDQKIKIYPTRRKQEQNTRNQLDLLISKQMALQLLEKGFPQQTRIKFNLHEKNFEVRENKRGRGRGGRGGGNHRQRHQRNYNYDEQRQDEGDNKYQQRQRKKKVYVDKQTGMKSDNKKEYQKRIVQERDRQYSKKRAQEIGDALGSFRKKKSEAQTQKPEQTSEQQNSLSIQKSIQKQKPQNSASWKKKEVSNIEEVPVKEEPNKIQKKQSTEQKNSQNPPYKHKNNYKNSRIDKRDYQSPKNKNYGGNGFPKEKKKYTEKQKNPTSQKSNNQKKSSYINKNTFQDLMDSDDD